MSVADGTGLVEAIAVAGTGFPPASGAALRSNTFLGGNVSGTGGGRFMMPAWIPLSPKPSLMTKAA